MTLNEGCEWPEGDVYCWGCAHEIIHLFTNCELQLLLLILAESGQRRAEDFKKALEAHGEDEKGLQERFLNDFGLHEAQDRAFIAGEHVENYLTSHPTVIMDEESYRLAQIAANALAGLYQRIGNIEVSK